MSFLKKEPEQVKISDAEKLYRYCVDNGFGAGMTEKWGIKHFEVICNNLMPKEKVVFVFIGIHNYVSATKHDNNFAYAITDKRIITAQKQMLGEVIQSVSWENINDITLSKGLLFGVITIDTYKEKMNVAVDKNTAQNIYDNIYSVYTKLKNRKSAPEAPASDPYSELKKLKELLDMSIISQEEFDAKKKQLLGL